MNGSSIADAGREDADRQADSFGPLRSGAPGSRTRWFVVNLDRSTDHLHEMTQNFAEVGLPFTRIPAVDGRSFTQMPAGVDRLGYRRAHGRDVTGGDIGCYFSHLRLMGEFLKSEASYAVALEDDAIVTSAAVRLVERLTAPGAPDDWDIVKFEAHHHGMGLTIRPLGEAHRLCALPTRPTGSAAYLVNRRAAEAIRDRLLPMIVPYDHAFDRGWALGLRVRAILPFPIDTRVHASTITASKPWKAAAWQKAPTLLWRSGTEAMRVVSALHAWVAPSRPLPWPRRPTWSGGDPFDPDRASLSRGSDPR